MDPQKIFIAYGCGGGGGGVPYVSHSLGKKIIETLTSFYGLYCRYRDSFFLN